MYLINVHRYSHALTTVKTQQLMMMVMLAIMLSLMHSVYLRHQAAAVADRIPCVISVDRQQLQQQQQPSS